MKPLSHENPVYLAAINAASEGISVCPPMQNGTKAPMGEWKRYQSERPADDTITAWYAQGLTGVGWVCGAVSGDLEVLDFDDRSVWAEYQRMCRDAGLDEVLAKVIAGYLEHSPNGAHLVYRCSAVQPNQKLAKRKDPHAANRWKSIIETRGEGGYIVVAPTHGSVNASGSYVLQSGGVESIATITPEERAGLFMVARVFDESVRPGDNERKPTSLGREGTRPGDEFNAKATWDDVLTPHGWVKVFGRMGTSSWRRPGKKEGISATTNHAGSDLFYPFTTSTVFEAERGYSKFSAYAILNHNADFAEAARAIQLQYGYGLEVPERRLYPDVDLSQFQYMPAGEAKLPVLADLMRVPGAVGELADWMEAGANRSQPVLALGASIAAMSAILGQRVETETGLRSNLYVLGLGESGSGKERARKTIIKLFDLLGLEKVIGGAFASGAAIEASIERSPVRLFLIDEIGHLLGTMKEGGSDHLKDIVPVLLQMYSASESSYRKREYASKDSAAVITKAPSLSIYGTTVPSNLWPNLTKAHVTNGLLGRLLVFESTDRYPHWRAEPAPPPPSTLMDVCGRWAKARTNTDPDAGNIERFVEVSPLTVTSTAAAKRVFADLEQTMRKQIEKIWARGGDQAPYTRVTATAMKLALIRACGVSADAPEITEADASWGSGLAWYLTETMVAKVSESAPENKTEEMTQRIIKAVRREGSIARSALLSKFPSLTARQLDELVKTLIEAGRLDIEMQKGESGRPKTVYRVVV